MFRPVSAYFEFAYERPSYGGPFTAYTTLDHHNCNRKVDLPNSSNRTRIRMYVLSWRTESRIMPLIHILEPCYCQMPIIVNCV